MNFECHPITVLPHITRLYSDYLAAPEDAPAVLGASYPTAPSDSAWMTHPPQLSPGHRQRLAAHLLADNTALGASPSVIANIQRLADGAAAVVTGQQVGLFGGPLLTLLKAATCIRRANQASTAGHPHVPIFWVATEDHDLAEMNQASFLTKHEVETLSVPVQSRPGVPVGSIRFGDEISAVVERASELLTHAPISEILRTAYAPGQSFGSAFARFLSTVFAAHGLIVIDAASQTYHALGASTLKFAIDHAAGLEDSLRARSEELIAAGYHAQVLVNEGNSLLFLIDSETGERLPLRRIADSWKAGSHTFTTAELCSILDTAPQRISPNALLRPVFQDTILPTSLYIGGPAEIAYFAQSQVVYDAVFGRTTPVQPRLSATLIEPAVAKLMTQYELDLPAALHTSEDLAHRLAARAMPIEGKKRLAAAGNAMEQELAALTEWAATLDKNLGAAAEVSASKMRYQMDRLRRMTATFELQRQSSLAKHAAAITLNLFPGQHPQERVLSGAWFLSRVGETLPALLIEAAASDCTGHKAIYL